MLISVKNLLKQTFGCFINNKHMFKCNAYIGSLPLMSYLHVIYKKMFVDDLKKANDAYVALNDELEGTLKDLGGM